MELTLLYILSSVVLVSIISFIGSLFLIKKTNIDKVLLYFVSLSAGTLLGGAFLHLLPEAVEKTGSFSIFLSLLVLSGIATFFLLDKLIHWSHSHGHKHPHSHNHAHSLHAKKKKDKKSIAYLNLSGDAIHNFLDGLVIAGSYLVSIPTGIATTIAVTVHEVPQELADFGVLLYSGFSKKKALALNFLSAVTAIFGAVIGIAIGINNEMFINAIVPFAGGAFIYIAGSNLIPEIVNSKKGARQLFQQFLMFLIGIAIMYGLLLVK